MPMRPPLFLVVAITLLAGWDTPARAELRLPTLFGDHAVLQRDKALPVWGWAEVGATVDVEINGTRGSGTADKKGRWRVTLPPLKSGGPFEMTVTSGVAEHRIRDVYVGDVWLCSGQSNMAHGMNESENGEKDAAASDYPLMRTFRVRESIADEPRDDAAGASWIVCSPQTAMSFSAVAFYFGREIQKAADVPVGLVVCAWGGSSVAAWTSREALEAPSVRRQMPFDVFGWREPTRPNKLYAGMLHPLAPYGIRGVIWYQGETDAEPPFNAYLYRHALTAMVHDWRRLWDQPDLPVYLVQLPILRTRDWTVLRESQDSVSRLPHVEMITTLDISRPMSLHPGNKHETGARLADLVLTEQYGERRPAYQPRYARSATLGSSIRIELERAEGLKTADGQPPRAFSIAGEDRKFVNAEATINGQAIVVRHASIEKPVAVRYAWSNDPRVNVANGDGLPLAPFRTDDWPVAGQGEAWAELPTKQALARQFSGADVTQGWTWVGSNLSAETIARRKLLRRMDGGAVQIAVPDRPLKDGATRSPRVSWRSGADALAAVDPAKGCTVELDALTFSATSPLSGMELHVQVAHPDGRAIRYRIAIAPSRVFALNNDEVRVIGHNLNTSGAHAYRIAVRPEGSAQVYFDSQELGTLPGEWIDQPEVSHHFIAIGKPYEGGTFTATINRISCDPGGAVQP